MKRILLSLLVGCQAAPLLHAGSGASFLKLGVGARAVGLGSAYTALANDVTALHWNPAGLARLEKREVGAMHAEMFSDTRFDFVGYAHPARSFGFGIGAVYLSQGSIEGRAIDRSKSEDFSASDAAVTVGGGKAFGSRLHLGLGLKLIQSRISGHSASGYAFDIGAAYEPFSAQAPRAMRLGLAAQNIGPKMRFLEDEFNLPSALAAGIAYRPFKSLLLSSDLKRQIHTRAFSFNIGAEFTPVSLVSLRAGYLTHAARSSASAGTSLQRLDSLGGLGLGLGFKLGPGAVDYAFSPAGELGNVQRLSLSLQF